MGVTDDTKQNKFNVLKRGGLKSLTRKLKNYQLGHLDLFSLKGGGIF